MSDAEVVGDGKGEGFRMGTPCAQAQRPELWHQPPSFSASLLALGSALPGVERGHSQPPLRA